MYFILILFFGSLFSIVFMIGRKLLLLQNGRAYYKSENILETPVLDEWKILTVKNMKKHGYVALVATIRFYVRSSNILRNKYQEVKAKIRNKRLKNGEIEAEEKREASKFLKMVSEYKEKIREIKHKIKEEENL